MHGMTVRFEHITTQKRLHSHNLRPPVSDVDWQNEVSGYGFPGFGGDANDNWVVEIEKGDGRDRSSSKRLRTISTTFRLRHALTGCYLFSHKVKLPDWGYEQQEVTCNTNPVKPNSLWYAESNIHPQCMAIILLAHPDYDCLYRLQMGLIQKKQITGYQASWPSSLNFSASCGRLIPASPIDTRLIPDLQAGLSYVGELYVCVDQRLNVYSQSQQNFWVKDHRQIYLLGNPFVWWLGTASIVLYAIARVVLILRDKRGCQDFNHSTLLCRH